MAPMAGISTVAFRRSVRRWGAGLVFTEMISSYGTHYRNRRTLEYLACAADEHPIGYQLFGADPAVMAQAARHCRAAGADLIDINMACPARKVLKTGAGAALLGEPVRAAAMVAAVVDAVGGEVPVTVKIRVWAARRRRGRAPGGARPRRRGRRRALHPPAYGRPTLPRPCRPQSHVRPGRRATRAGDRLGRRRRPRRGSRPAPRRRRRRDARPSRSRQTMAVCRSARRPPHPRQRPNGSRN